MCYDLVVVSDVLHMPILIGKLDVIANFSMKIMQGVKINSHCKIYSKRCHLVAELRISLFYPCYLSLSIQTAFLFSNQSEWILVVFGSASLANRQASPKNHQNPLLG